MSWVTTLFFLAALGWTAVSFLSYRDWALFFQIGSVAWVVWAVVWTAMRLAFAGPPRSSGSSKKAIDVRQNHRSGVGIIIASCLAVFVFAVLVAKWPTKKNKSWIETFSVAMKTASERLSGEGNQGPATKKKPEGTPRPEKAPPELEGLWSVQVGAFRSEQGAIKAARILMSEGYEAYVTRGEVQAINVYRTNVGRFRSREEAERLLTLLKGKEAYRMAFVARM